MMACDDRERCSCRVFRQSVGGTSCSARACAACRCRPRSARVTAQTRSRLQVSAFQARARNFGARGNVHCVSPAGTAMLINYGYEITIAVTKPTPVICLLDVHLERRADVQAEAPFRSVPPVATSSYIDA